MAHQQSQPYDEASGGRHPLALNARQRKVHQALSDLHPELANVYLGIVRVLDDPLNPAAAYQAAHLGRDICYRLYAYLDVTYGGPGKEKHQTTAAEVFASEPDHPVVEHFLAIAERLVKCAHLRGPKKPPPERNDVAATIGQLEEVLLALLGPYYEVFPELDTLLAVQEPTPDEVERLKTLLSRKGPARRQYFFGNLQHGGWVRPLLEAGFFSSPPQPVEDAERGMVSYAPWPESHYLARIAPSDPGAVAEAVLRFLEPCRTPTSPRVVSDLLTAALSLPVDLAARVAKKIAGGPGPLEWTLSEQLGELMARLAKDGRGRDAVHIAQKVLALRPDDSDRERWEKAGLPGFHRPRPVARMQEFGCSRILEEALPTVIRATGVDGLRMVCNLLHDALRIENREGERDCSYIRHPAIEDHPQNHGHSLTDVLVSAVRDSVLLLADEMPDRLSDALAELERQRQCQRHPFSVFQRIVLYLLSARPDARPCLASKLLTDRAVFDDDGLRHEYALLLRASFTHLSEEGQGSILSWIADGPDVTVYRENGRALHGQEPSEEDIATRVGTWQRDRLALLDGMLPPQWQRRYEDLVAQHGAPYHPDFAHYSEIRRGNESPASADELRAMTTPELVAYLDEWEPESPSHWGPSTEGLSQALAAAVKSDPERYSQEALQFQGLAPVYVGGYVQGLCQAVRESKPIAWKETLALCDWVLGAPEPQPERDGEPQWPRERGWQVARSTIADLVHEGLSRDTIPIDLRVSTWRVIEPLTRDPHPTPEADAKYGDQHAGPVGLADDSTRGKAVRCVVGYALWLVRSASDGKRDATQVMRAVWQDCPEVRAVLEWHLDPSNDPSPAIRAVYGENLPQLVYFSPEWVRANLCRLFPTAPELSALREAAWGAYIIRARARTEAFALLREQYQWAVDHIGQAPTYAWSGTVGLEEGLCWHLVGLYWGGHVGLHDPLLRGFYAEVPVATKTRAVAGVGHALNEDNADSAAATQRLTGLLEWRIAEVTGFGDDATQSAELVPFGWGFIVDSLDEDWRMSRLLEVLRLTAGRIEPEQQVAEKLVQVAQRYPLQSVQCLTLMVEGAQESWQLYGWEKHVRATLQAALASGSQDAQDAAVDLINTLGEKGHHEFRDLLGPQIGNGE
jgi:hypothetical protein